MTLFEADRDYFSCNFDQRTSQLSLVGFGLFALTVFGDDSIRINFRLLYWNVTFVPRFMW